MGIFKKKPELEMISVGNSGLLVKCNPADRMPLLGSMDTYSGKTRFSAIMLTMPGFMMPLMIPEAAVLAIPALGIFLGLNALAAIGHRAESGNKYLDWDSQLKYRQVLPFRHKTENRELVESYFIHHPQAFHGVVIKDAAVGELIATHLVKTYLVQGKSGRPLIEQEITEVAGHKWDKNMDSIDSLMTEPKAKQGVTMQNNMVSRITINPFITSNL